MAAFLKGTVLVLTALFIIVICFKLVIKRMLSNIRFFTSFSKSFYDYFYSIKQIRHLRTNNFGYAPVDEEIANYGPDLQHGLQLYKEVVKSESGAVIQEGAVIAEISCGKGGGAEYLIKKLKPQTYIGVDFSQTAIDFCNHSYKTLGNAQFVRANADNLPFADNSVNLVINVEASHLYKNINQFLSEVHRILKTDGGFLFADYRCIEEHPIEMLEEELSMADFSIIEKRVITPQIYRACLEASNRREQLIKEVVPWYLRKSFRHYAVVNGTKKFNKLKNGKIVYMIYHLKKAPSNSFEI